MLTKESDIELPTKTIDKNWIQVRNKAKERKKPVSKYHLSEEDFRHMLAIEKNSFLDKIGRIIGEKKDKIQRINKSGDRVTVPLTERAIDSIAEEIDCKVGKWLLFFPEKEIDDTWKKIATAVINGQLGSCEYAKVATALQKKDNYLICVYTPNYLNGADVMVVRKKLREMGFTQTLYYKPDIYTYLGIYTKNPHVKASRYKS